MITDTHSHLSFKAYDNDRDETIKRTQKEGVVCIDIGTNFQSSQKAVELAKKHDNIFAAIGMHPEESEKFDKEKYKKLAQSSKKVVAIGEIGLDYIERPEEKQKQIFIQQLELAKELDLPVIIHCRMAHADTINILKKRSVRGVIHCFTGTWQEAQEYLDLGFYLGINGIIYKMDLTEVIKKCPLDRTLAETDCPFLTPPDEGKSKRNEPIFIKHIIQKIADLKGLSFEEIAEKTTQNAKKLFKI
jgi:TatD DNase family protein